MSVAAPPTLHRLAGIRQPTRTVLCRFVASSRETMHRCNGDGTLQRNATIKNRAHSQSSPNLRSSHNRSIARTARDRMGVTRWFPTRFLFPAPAQSVAQTVGWSFHRLSAVMAGTVGRTRKCWDLCETSNRNAAVARPVAWMPASGPSASAAAAEVAGIRCARVTVALHGHGNAQEPSATQETCCTVDDGIQAASNGLSTGHEVVSRHPIGACLQWLAIQVRCLLLRHLVRRHQWACGTRSCCRHA